MKTEELIKFDKARLRRKYLFTPQDDITPLEAAYLDHFFAVMKDMHEIERYGHWNKIKRHLTLSN